MFNLSCLSNQSSLFCLNEKSISGEQFLNDIAHYRQKIQTFIGSPIFLAREAKSQPQVILFHADVYQFSVRLFALAAEKITVILPANGQSKTLEALFPIADAIAGDFPRDIAFTSIEGYQADPLKLASERTTTTLLWPTNSSIIFSTSGSSGQAKLVKKSWQQLSIELATLNTTFVLERDTVFLSTVSHQHIYGLLFRLLWPISQGAKISQTIEYPEHGIQVLTQFTSVVLVSSPAFLKRLVLDNVLASQKDNFHQIFSSGGPLADNDAIELYQQFSKSITQVYGSTETGGIGYRSVNKLPAAKWQVFSGICLAVEPNTQRFRLNSPYVSESNMLLDDKGELFDNGQFSLLGRVDRTIKLEEKRLNLDEVEQHLLLSPLINECRIMVLKNNRSSLAAVVSLTEEGLALKKSLSAFAFNQRLKQHLLERFERVCLPRKWRYLDQLPYNSQGKLSHSALEALFE